MIDFKEHINNIHHFPIEGIIYRDIQPILADGFLFNSAIQEMGELIGEDNLPQYWVGIESRGFLFASALAQEFGGGVRMIRKKGKLPNKKLISVKYGLEYGKDELEMAHIPQHDFGTCVVVDDVYATGGTMEAGVNLCEMVGLEVVYKLTLVDIGIKKQHDVKSLIKYS